MNYAIYALEVATSNAFVLMQMTDQESEEYTKLKAAAYEFNEAIAVLKRHEATKVPHHPPELVRDHPHASD